MTLVEEKRKTKGGKKKSKKEKKYKEGEKKEKEASKGVPPETVIFLYKSCEKS